MPFLVLHIVLFLPYLVFQRSANHFEKFVLTHKFKKNLKLNLMLSFHFSEYLYLENVSIPDPFIIQGVTLSVTFMHTKIKSYSCV